jgi:FkbM family methyltransferase
MSVLSLAQTMRAAVRERPVNYRVPQSTLPNPMSLLLRILTRLPRPIAEALDRLRKRSPLARSVARSVLGGALNSVVTIPQGVGAGLKFDTTGGVLRYGLGLAEETVQDALAEHLRPGDVFYDLGANVGFLSLIGARLVGEGGQVVAFEPVPTTAALLRRNASLNGFDHVDVVEAAVGARAGRARLVLEEASQMAHLSTVPGMAEAGTTSEIDVEVLTLDAHLDDGASPPDVIKIDVEGAEIDALQGMARTISAHHPTIICEIHGTLDEVTRILTEHGYDVRRMTDAYGASLDHLLATHRSRE